MKCAGPDACFETVSRNRPPPFLSIHTHICKVRTNLRRARVADIRVRQIQVQQARAAPARQGRRQRAGADGAVLLGMCE